MSVIDSMQVPVRVLDAGRRAAYARDQLTAFVAAAAANSQSMSVLIAVYSMLAEMRGLMADSDTATTAYLAALNSKTPEDQSAELQAITAAIDDAVAQMDADLPHVTGSDGKPWLESISLAGGEQTIRYLQVADMAGMCAKIQALLDLVPAS